MDMMQPRELILLEIDSLFEAFDEQLAYSKLHHGPIPIIELDIMKQTVRNLYQQLHDLEKYQERKLPVQNNVPTNINTNKPAITEDVISQKEITTEKVVHAEISLAEPVAKEEEIIPSQNITANKDFTFEEMAKSISEERTAVMNTEKKEYSTKTDEVENISESLMNNNVIIETEVASSIAVDKPIEVIAVKEEIKITKTLFDDYAPTIAEKFHHEESVYDRMSKSNTDVSIAEKLQAKPVEDLQKSIGINERFLFLNELFNGNPQHYSDAISRLNSFTNLQDAKSYLNDNLSAKYGWNKSSIAYLELSKLIERRLISA
jgi:hypothetical protein